ncbi:MAG TPA: prepilin-type N-terminal cleavage/methylation domain-containing protein [Candidatus Vogelbacteria bacterium]|nr:prepilin-type N-terminal cleavage/methylation domain-containing protein [Candidatus Vogelbacteria bacterium]
MFGNKKGFSLIELLIVLGIAIFIILAIWYLWIGSFRFNTEIRNNLTSVAEIRRAGELIAKDIRNISSPNEAIYPILEADSFSFSFLTIDTFGQKLRVRYFSEDGQLKRGVVYLNSNPPYYDDSEEQSTVILRNIGDQQSPLFEYFDKHYQPGSLPLTEPVDINLIRLIGVNIYNQHSQIVFSTKVLLRNIRNNL